MIVVVVQSPGRVQLFVTPWTAVRQASLSLTISRSSLKFMPIWISDAIQSSHPLPPSSFALNFSQHQGLFQWAFSAPLLLQSFKCPSDFWPFLLFFFLLPISFYSSYLQFYLWLEVHSRISASLSFTVSKSLDGTLSGLQPVSTWESHSTWPCSSLLDHIIKAMVFLVVMYRCQSWDLKKVKHQSIDAFELWCWRRLLGVLWTAGRSNQSILKEINPEYSLEGLMLELKLQYFGHVMQRMDPLEKPLILGKIESKRKRGRQRMRWLGGITDSTDMNLTKFQ